MWLKKTAGTMAFIMAIGLAGCGKSMPEVSKENCTNPNVIHEHKDVNPEAVDKFVRGCAKLLAGVNF